MDFILGAETAIVLNVTRLSISAILLLFIVLLSGVIVSGSVGSVTSPVEESVGSSRLAASSGVSFITLSNISNSFAKRLSLFTLKSLPKKSLSQLRILSRSLARRDFFLVGRVTFSALVSEINFYCLKHMYN